MYKTIRVITVAMPILAGLAVLSFSQQTAQNSEGEKMRHTTVLWENVTLNVMTPDLEWVVTEDGSYGYEISGRNQQEIKVAVINSTLQITETPDFAYRLFHFTEYLGGLNKLKITLYSPKVASFNMVKIRHVSGNTAISGVVCRSMGLESSSGSISVASLQADNLEIIQSSGKLDMDTCVAGTAKIRHSSGDTSVTVSEFKGSQMLSSSGKIDFTGILTGNHNIEATSGKISLKLTGKKKDYELMLKTSGGRAWIDNQAVKLSDQTNLGPNRLQVNTSSGDIEIHFDK